MAEDIAPALYEKIQKDFNRMVSADREISRIRERIAKKRATHRDTQLYSIRIGDHAAAALKKNIREDVLPDGKLYYNIAQRTVRPQLVKNYEMISETATEIQQQINDAAGIRLKAQKAPVPEDRLRGLIDKLCSYPQFAAAAWLLEEPVKNWTQHVADDIISENADFQSRSGVLVTITREVYANCCEWCEEAAGSFEFGEQPDNFYQRHEFCRCMISSKSQKTGKASNSYYNRMREAEAAARIERITALAAESDQRG